MFPFGWFHLLRWSRNPVGSDMRVPLMGVLKEFQNSRMASQSSTLYGTNIYHMISDLTPDKDGVIAYSIPNITFLFA